MAFIDEDFLLHSEPARRLYHGFADGQPILDYHNHLPPAEIAEDRNFPDLAAIWLGGDHYKWRAMRADGVEESLITGDAAPRDKFLAWARTVPHTLRNPLYHWTHLELKRTFGIDTILNEATAPAVWDEANRLLATPDFTPQALLRRANVVALCTTDDPADPLTHHERLKAQGLRVYPAFRPDHALAIDRPLFFNRWTDRLAEAADLDIVTLADFENALRRRHDAFHALGARLSDHGLPHCPRLYPDEAEAAAIFDRARAGREADPDDADRFAGHLMLFFGRLDAERGWTKQLHLGAHRDLRTKSRQNPASGYDAIGDWRQGQALAGYLDRLDQDDALPQTIVYNNNPADNYVVSTVVGSFAQGRAPGKMQFGAGWWFLDSKQGIEWQLDALSNNGLLARFVGMLTDSRSFMSFPRHEYFRRLLCDRLGGEMARGELPDDYDLVGGLVRDVCFENARRYLGLAVEMEAPLSK